MVHAAQECDEEAMRRLVEGRDVAVLQLCLEQLGDGGDAGELRAWLELAKARAAGFGDMNAADVAAAAGFVDAATFRKATDVGCADKASYDTFLAMHRARGRADGPRCAGVRRGGDRRLVEGRTWRCCSSAWRVSAASTNR